MSKIKISDFKTLTMFTADKSKLLKTAVFNDHFDANFYKSTVPVVALKRKQEKRGQDRYILAYVKQGENFHISSFPSFDSMKIFAQKLAPGIETKHQRRNLDLDVFGLFQEVKIKGNYKFKIIEGYDNFKGVKLYKLSGINNDYVGEWHEDRQDVILEFSKI